MCFKVSKFATEGQIMIAELTKRAFTGNIEPPGRQLMVRAAGY